ncbi:hypothetical protein GTH52_02785 [Clostridium tyrobutyricum]|uniref:Uncharacterized protein n=1 Tax=Clostridium tyrobutyricum DIVETGP TaxID=1408889 RepID=W6N4G3_CLOTY|nr:hypothetical protein [Clostridium tyrobutyricum]ANP69775.1 hypothetical protein BA182_08830 [Clostridium tyrobutyricum]MBV4415221.1 hypothetical protein [Clostridium tyrobutyricum]MBV4420892.1 hypothetical protein [Clostridium tyrobutyricum]MBV4424001.1 hypothetical protein [Clostridium tyrobutyricum]MBV4429804.1 hypothetical protein [Clostridium tyrobutyricum]
MKYSKYIYIIISMSVLCFIFIVKNFYIIRSINEKQDELIRIERKFNRLNIKKETSYSDTINSLKNIEGIKILSFMNNNKGYIAVASITLKDSNKVKNTFEKIKMIKNFYCVDSIKVDTYTDKNLGHIININFSK